ncbi:hypothetical protein Lal_00001448 [Lupinus albus]|nr:hypothetical protein Lal_00001448 [Lupinus albus]
MTTKITDLSNLSCNRENKNKRINLSKKTFSTVLNIGLKFRFSTRPFDNKARTTEPRGIIRFSKLKVSSTECWAIAVDLKPILFTKNSMTASILLSAIDIQNG